ncbi:hypothetical protein F4561_002052 [Lipingzhangella halophila]|uniref:Uncharacterized protein n=1 Tax=Lipingzhangella halophila TaxID=1783352 RepID=A0A7W7RFY0_9ACTN|nr:hypothetical protein [Lipingzhangella halophila]MBB4931232.1 hypothetical protein [Lipingzhangella halophila]
MTETERTRLAALRDRFAELGCPDPEDAALSEFLDDIPQLARFLAVRHIWPRLIDEWANEGVLERFPAADRLLASGADRGDLAKVARLVAYETAFTMLYDLSAGGDPDAPDGTPEWCLQEVGPDGEPTGRYLDSLHEDLLMLDPSGREGADLFE